VHKLINLSASPSSSCKTDNKSSYLLAPVCAYFTGYLPDQSYISYHLRGPQPPLSIYSPIAEMKIQLYFILHGLEFTSLCFNRYKESNLNLENLIRLNTVIIRFFEKLILLIFFFFFENRVNKVSCFYMYRVR